jgi:protein-S-isoprenylcysteine O-methyltransferase Ste14
VGEIAGRIARWRVPLGFVSAAAVVWLARPTRWSLCAGAAVAAVGELLRVWAAGHLEKGREVTSSGPYQYMRHPLYLGSTIMGVGLAIAADRPIVGACVVAYLGITLTAAIRSEEAHLTDKFGDAYPAYREGTSRPALRRFSLARAARNREYRAAIGLLLAIAVLAVKARLGL